QSSRSGRFAGCLDRYDLDQGAESDEVRRIPRVQRQSVGLSDRSNEQVGETRPVRRARTGHRGNDLTEAASGCNVEIERIKECFYLLQPYLASRLLHGIGRQVRPRG